MCGITGFWQRSSGGDLERLAIDMASTLKHRGPDDSGFWVESELGLALSHRRLAILDLSASGHQPMKSSTERYVLVFNGEIYNYRDLQKEIEHQTPGGFPVAWRGHSDTEVLLEAFECWGIEGTLGRSVGMFAMAVWDCRAQTLTLIRDRLGEKPLYYGYQNDTFLFGSELKAIKAHPAFRGDINRDALTLFLRHNYIPTPYSIYEDIHKLLPGYVLTLRSRDIAERALPRPVPYWYAKDITNISVDGRFKGTETDAIDELSRLLDQSISGQMVADVPVGAFLSGGVDSSTVVAFMQARSARPVKTFTIGFREKEYNEAENARQVAVHLKTDHTELYVTPRKALDVIPKLPTLYDEPFSDSSQIPTYLVSELARRHVTVSLSGDGGDELFGGYNRYFWAARLWQKLGWMPRPLRAVFAAFLISIPETSWDKVFSVFKHYLPVRFQYGSPGDKLHKLAEILAVKSPEEIYLGLVSHWKEPAALVMGGVERPTVLTDSKRWAEISDFESRMMYLDLISYLPDDILVKIDRAAMSVSLESRIPLLDHRIVEFAWKLPLSMKIQNTESKWILRQMLYRHVPKELIDRPKMGFGVPIDIWLRGPLRAWAENLLDESRIRGEGFFDPVPIRSKWREHLSGRRNWQYYLWDVLTFQAWLDKNKNSNNGPVWTPA